MIIDLTDEQVRIIEDFLDNWMYQMHHDYGDEFVNDPENQPYFDLQRKIDRGRS